MNNNDESGRLITFYSYKGGVGRSMALANCGVILAQWGYNVLLVDFDLEAPGLESFFSNLLDSDQARHENGLVDHLHYYFHRRSTASHRIGVPKPIEIRLPRVSGNLKLVTAGRRDDNYFKKVTELDFRDLHTTRDAGRVLEEFRGELHKAYDFTLVDSRTGLTDIGGVCTVQLPDAIILLSTATEQALMGGIDVIQRASEARQRLPFPRAQVPTLPIPSRFDSSSELRLTTQWLDRFAAELRAIYSQWLPRAVKPRDILDVTKLPHVPFFSYGEGLPALEYGTRDPSGLGYAYENLAALVALGFADADQLLEDRGGYVRRATRDHGWKDPSPREPRIFISYSRADKRWLKRLQTHLAPLTRSRDLTFWSDEELVVGKSWRSQIVDAISKADVALLLVSPDYLASEWLEQTELPVLLSAAEERGLRVLWLPIGPTLLAETPLSRFQALWDPAKPLQELSVSQQERILAESVKRIAAAAGRKY